MSLDKAFTNSKQESLEPVIGYLDSNRWEEYRSLRLQMLEDEPIAFEDPLQGKEQLMATTEIEWKTMLEARITDGKSKNITLIAQEGNKLVGTIYAESIENNGIKKIVVQNLFTTDTVRGQGIGKKLLQAIITECDSLKEEGLKEIELHVFGTQQTAINLYKSLGFEVAELIKEVKEYQGAKIDEYIMRKILR